MQTDTSRRLTRRTILQLLAVGSAGSLLAACQPATPAAAPTTAPAAAKPTTAPAAAPAAAPTTAPAAKAPAAMKNLSLRLNWYVGGLHAPFLLAKDRGYYAANGINLDIGEGGGSAKTAQLIANKSDTFGMADAGSLMLTASQGAPIKSVMSLLNTSSYGVISLKDAGIKTIKDVEGKKLAITAGDALSQLWPAVVAANKLDANKIQLVQMDAAAKPPAVMEKRVDALLGGIDDQYFTIKYKGFDVDQVKFADIGVNTVGITLLVHPDFLKDNADAVRGFVQATIRGWEDAKKDPDAAVQSALKVKSDLDAQSTKDQLAVDIALLESAATKGKPIGYGAAADWDQTLKLMKQYRDLQTDRTADSFYTNEFIPNA